MKTKSKKTSKPKPKPKPMLLTQKEAVDLLVEREVKKWGEAAREALIGVHSRKDLGILLRNLADDANDPEAPRWRAMINTFLRTAVWTDSSGG